jgi:lipoate-protein ligase A
MANSSRSGGELQPCRLIFDEPADGAWNMAFDEALLEAAAAQGGWTLRFYGWSTPTLSLGYFQRWEDRRQHAASLACPCVRRSSGGGAIVHDMELTYSLVVPGSLRLPLLPATLYELVHQALAESLHDLANVAAVLHESTPHGVSPEREPFLCFQRRANGDLLIGSAKIAGSAQRRLQGAVLQHGSVLLHVSAAAPELPGLSAVSPVAVSSEDLRTAWSVRLGTAFGLKYMAAEDLQSERQRAAELLKCKYGSEGWNRRR